MVYDKDLRVYVEVDVSLPGEKNRVREETRKRFARRAVEDEQAVEMGASLNSAGSGEVVEKNTASFAVVIGLDTIGSRTLPGQTPTSTGGGPEGTELFPVEISSDTEDKKRQKMMGRRARRVERRKRRRERRRERDERRKSKDARRMERVERN